VQQLLHYKNKKSTDESNLFKKI